MKTFISIILFTFCFSNLNAQTHDIIEENAILLTQKLDEIIDLNSNQERRIEQIYKQYLKDYYALVSNNFSKQSAFEKQEQKLDERLNAYINQILNATQKEQYRLLLESIKD